MSENDICELLFNMKEYESDLRSNKHYLSSSENRAWKKFRPAQDFL